MIIRTCIVSIIIMVSLALMNMLEKTSSSTILSIIEWLSGVHVYDSEE